MDDVKECPTCGCEGWNGVTNCAIEEREFFKAGAKRLERKLAALREKLAASDAEYVALKTAYTVVRGRADTVDADAALGAKIDQLVEKASVLTAERDRLAGALATANQRYRDEALDHSETRRERDAAGAEARRLAEALRLRRHYPGDKQWRKHPRLTAAWRRSEERIEAALAAHEEAGAAQ